MARNNDDIRIIAYYLPQFHRTPENDKWWGEGFTEWTNVKAAESLYEGHYQPREPLDDNYYNLLDDEVIEWQSKIAEEHGIYGFCFYHYWFHGKLLLEKPVENYLKNNNCKTHFCICWANESWTNSWAKDNDKVLIRQEYGDEEEWKSHFDYLYQFFNDDRYIKVDDKPLFVIYNAHIIPKLESMLSLWEKLAKEKGLKGITFYTEGTYSIFMDYPGKELFKKHIEYQPQLAYSEKKSEKYLFLRKIKRRISRFFYEKFGFDPVAGIGQKNDNKTIEKYSYDDIWQRILERVPENEEKYVPGAFVDWDNTPRKKYRGFVIDGATPDKFKTYMTEQIRRAHRVYKSNELFVFAWNEWAEGGYLEPDKKYGYGYLEAIKQALEESRSKEQEIKE